MLQKIYEYRWYIVGGIFAGVIFVVLAMVSQSYADTLRALTERAGVGAVLSYIGILALSIVFAPLGTGFLLPIAANAWGPLFASLYSITGWSIGSVIAFFIARRYGVKLFRNNAILNRVRDISGKAPALQFFWLVVAMRMALPVDILSYALGFATSMKYGAFILSTIIGIAPFAFAFNYAAVATMQYQVMVSIVSTGISIWGVYYFYKRSQKDGHHIKK